MKKTMLVFGILLVAIIAQASTEAGASHGDEHIPLSQIGWQAANLGVLLGAIIFFMKKSVVDAFSARQKNFLNQSEKTKSALKEAETALSGIKTKLSELEAGEKKSLADAQHEASLLKAHIVSEAEASAQKLKAEVVKTIENELGRAKNEINNKILNEAVAAAKGALSARAATAPGQEANFVKQLGQVGQ